MLKHLPDAPFDASTTASIHIMQRKLLEDYINGKSKQPPDPKLTSCNADCPLAMWLHHQESKDFKDIRLLNQICSTCEKFQSTASQAVLLTNLGKDELAKEVIQAGGAFCEASSLLQQELAQLHAQLNSRPMEKKTKNQ